ncbi:sigma-70 family RNA polymerase sigma factor [Methylibium sp.]|uniref:sigma-70 family RNA polymerase sigma factor n=1 Tax=Methylibium sp. TaxID=2067992 RepID=UPI001812881C|nr:sigma-70 family RNA polymerase sigma factor [Methylibium sp.]MBA3588996.1 sigma-70 family RNA polymerase sigma factor [Methylibium sp.]
MRTSLDAPQGAAATQPTLGWQEMLTHRSYLLRYARSRLQDPSLAEDAVHDVFVAVLCGRARFGGRAAPRSWLVGILRHKIVDLIRTRSGTDSLDAMADDEAADEPVCPRCRPDERAEQRERLAHTLARIDGLPATLRHAVQLRLVHDRGSDEVCRTLDISEDNLHVRLHRARRQLLACAAA